MNGQSESKGEVDISPVETSHLEGHKLCSTAKTLAQFGPKTHQIWDITFSSLSVTI